MPNKKCVEFYPKLRFLIFGNIHKSLTLQVGIGNIYIYILWAFSRTSKFNGTNKDVFIIN